MTAKLHNLSATNTYSGEGNMSIQLWDMDDATENGLVSNADYDSRQTNVYIASRQHNFGAGNNAVFDNIDVTAEVHDWMGFGFRVQGARYRVWGAG